MAIKRRAVVQGRRSETIAERDNVGRALTHTEPAQKRSQREKAEEPEGTIKA